MESNACLTTQSGSNLPLQSCSVKAEVQGFLSGVDSTLKYQNVCDSPVKVSFSFPLGEPYSLLAVEATIGEKRVRTAVESGTQDSRTGDKASSSDIFSISLGEVPAEAKIIIHLKFAGELPVTVRGEAKFTLPLVISDELARSQSSSVSLAEFNFKMKVKTDNVKAVSSPTHSLAIDRAEDAITVSLNETGTVTGNDNLVILLEQSDVIKVLYERGFDNSSECHAAKPNDFLQNPVVMISYSPWYGERDPASELIFLVDRSKSMKGWGIQNAKKALTLLLKSIPVNCVFNVVGFGSSYSSLTKKSVEYTQESFNNAMEFVNLMQVDAGEADLLSPLKNFIEQFPVSNYSRHIFVITAGSVNNMQDCIDMVSQKAIKCRVYTIGLGAGVSRELVNGLAKVGRGSAEIVVEGERIQQKVIESLKQSLQPSVASLELKFKMPEEFEVTTIPAEISPVLVGDKLVCYGLIKSKSGSSEALESKITGVMSLDGRVAGLKGMDCDRVIGYHIAFMIPPVTQDQTEANANFSMPVVHHCAAKSLLNDWTEESKSTASERECVNLSVESSIVCKHTKFVAMDEQDKPIEDSICINTSSMSKRDASSEEPTKHRHTGLFGGIKKLYKSATSHHHKATEEDLRYEALDTLIFIQQAEGYWLLKPLLDTILKKSEAEAQNSPEVSSEAWATLVALTILEHEYSKESMEWELVAVKAEKWLGSQKFDVSLSSLKETALTYIKNI